MRNSAVGEKTAWVAASPYILLQEVKPRDSANAINKPSFIASRNPKPTPGGQSWCPPKGDMPEVASTDISRAQRHQRPRPPFGQQPANPQHQRSKRKICGRQRPSLPASSRLARGAIWHHACCAASSSGFPGRPARLTSKPAKVQRSQRIAEPRSTSAALHPLRPARATCMC